MEKKFTINSVKEFEDLKESYFKAIPVRVIENILAYQDSVSIKEKEDYNTLITEIEVEQPKEIRNVFYRLEVIKENLNKYAKEGIENPDTCSIENLRKDIIKIKGIFGERWNSSYNYYADKYSEIRPWLRKADKLPPAELKGVLERNIGFIADKAEKGYVYLGPIFCEKIAKILRQEELAKRDSSPILGLLISMLGELYNKVDVDLKGLNKWISYNSINLLGRGSYRLSNIQCSSVNVLQGSITIKDSVIDSIILNSPKIKRVRIENVLTMKKPLLPKIKALYLKNVKTYEELEKEKKDNIRKALTSAVFIEDSIATTRPIDTVFRMAAKYERLVKKRK